MKYGSRPSDDRHFRHYMDYRLLDPNGLPVGDNVRYIAIRKDDGKVVFESSDIGQVADFVRDHAYFGTPKENGEFYP